MYQEDFKNFKKLAGEKAAEHAKDGMVVGLGTGSTVYYTILKLGAMVKDGLDIIGIPTSVRTEELAKEVAIPLTTLEEHPAIDLTIDGADEVNPELNLIKGMGGALLREKIVASVSKKVVIVADGSKVVDRLGTRSPLPVEVVPFGLSGVKNRLEDFDCTIDLRMGEEGVYVTDNGNYILDLGFVNIGGIDEPKSLEKEINNIPGVVENGLFINIANAAIIASEKGIKTLEQAL